MSAQDPDPAEVFSASLFLVRGDRREPVVVTVSPPRPSGGSYVCGVSAPGLFEGTVRIAGKEPARARALAFGFINRRVAFLKAALVDAAGNVVVFNESPIVTGKI